MIADTEAQGTDSGIPLGRYETKSQEELRSDKIEKSTAETTAKSATSHKVKLSKASLKTNLVVRANVDVEADKRKEEISNLNERLSKLRNKR
jgi:hypothetical protein